MGKSRQQESDSRSLFFFSAVCYLPLNDPHVKLNGYIIILYSRFSVYKLFSYSNIYTIYLYIPLINLTLKGHSQPL